MAKYSKSDKKWCKKLTDMGFNVRYGCNNSGEPDLIILLDSGEKIGVEIKKSYKAQFSQGYLYRCSEGLLTVGKNTKGVANKTFIQHILDNNKDAITETEKLLFTCTQDPHTKAWITPKGTKELNHVSCTSDILADFYRQNGNNFIIFDEDNLIFTLDGIFDYVFVNKGVKVHPFPSDIEVKVRIRSKPSLGADSYHNIAITTLLKNCKDTRDKIAIYQT
tara:strand:+ start:160 stop:819 length:660 start_codon:yes stop_codon:yes gene_type:complete